MRNRFVDHHHVIELYPAGRAMPEGTVRQVEGLFEEHYHRYHYLSKLADICRTRILALNEAGDLMGFASLQQKGKLAVLSNLLVASKAQGKGYGSALEGVRIKLSCDLQCITFQGIDINLDTRCWRQLWQLNNLTRQWRIVVRWTWLRPFKPCLPTQGA